MSAATAQLIAPIAPIPPHIDRGHMDLQLTGKRALVTGGSRGIGKAVAQALLAEGVAVAIGARHAGPLEASAAELGTTGATVVPIVVDTGYDESARDFVAGAAAALGGVDILVNSAAQPSGQARAPRVVELDADTFFADVNVKVLGYQRMIREVAPLMAANGWGRIINVDGLGSRTSGAVLTSMRNAAVVALTKNAADELGGWGINVTGVSPGLVRTEATPRVLAERAGQQGVSVADLEARIGAGYAIGRMVTAAEVAALVTWLASPLSVAVTGDVIACGGGVVGPIYY
jgi:NAD(P)-dependent dehydrogenase (short-subunit alcohol dehydrogenase family)